MTFTKSIFYEEKRNTTVLYFRTLLVSMINNTEDSSDYILTVIGVGAGVVLALITAVVIFSGIFTIHSFKCYTYDRYIYYT